jgi:hypothetical protein
MRDASVTMMTIGLLRYTQRGSFRRVTELYRSLDAAARKLNSNYTAHEHETILRYLREATAALQTATGTLL